MNQKILFKNCPSNNFPFWDEQSNDYKYREIANNFFDKRTRVGAITGVRTSSVRYDDKMPEKVKELLQYLASTFHLVYEYFNKDFEKTKLWFELPNPMIGKGLAPKDMVYIGRHKKLFQIVSSALKGDLP